MDRERHVSTLVWSNLAEDDRDKQYVAAFEALRISWFQPCRLFCSICIVYIGRAGTRANIFTIFTYDVKGAICYLLHARHCHHV